MKKIQIFFLSVLICFSVSIQAVNIPDILQSKVPLPEIDAKSWVLIEPETQWVIAEKNADMRIEPASLTKLMTLYVLFELIEKGQFNLQDKVRISEKARYVEGSRMFAELNSEVSVLDLLKGIIVQSGNDASIALAEYAAGSEEAFAVLMNETVKRLNLENSQFKNVSGLPDEGHYSSARDIALISRALIHDYEKYYPWFSIREMTHNNIKQPNRNRLLDRASWVDGLKTGHTESAGYCLAASGKQGDTRFIAVVAGSDNDKTRTDATYSLLQYGFANYEYYSPTQEGLVRKIRVYGGEKDMINLMPSEPMHAVLPKGAAKQDYANVDIDYRLDEFLAAPVKAGDNAGVIRVSYQDELIATSAMEAESSVALGSLIKRVKDSIKRLF
ncbi:MAG: D-alanyl-D-alanine carboxypeptidase family protein [Arenicella sp.]